jgi:hypothetical protein
MTKKYSRIRRLPAFVEDYVVIRARLRGSSPRAYLALPGAMRSIIDFISMFQLGMPVRRINIGGEDIEFHLAIVNIAHRKLHVRYHVDTHGICYLMTAWIDGDDEPDYDLSFLNS